MQSKRSNRWLWAAWGVVIIVVVAIYGRGFDAPFIWDDRAIFEDAHITHPQNWRAWFVAMDESPLAGRPVATVSMVANHAISGDNPASYHAVNLALHLACMALAAGVVFQTLTFRRPGKTPLVTDQKQAAWLTWAMVCLWSLHPLQTEAVQYIMQRTELLVVMFSLATLACAIRGWSDEKRQTPWHVLAAAMCLFGVGSKESIIAAPLLVLAWDYLFNHRAGLGMLRKSPWLYAGLVVACIFLGLVILSSPRDQSTGWDHGVSALDYLRTQAEVIGWYLRLLVWPYPQMLAYDWPIRQSWSWRIWPAVPLAIGVMATIWGLLRRKSWSFPLLVFYLVLAPTSSVLPIVTEVAAERRMYLPSLALIVMAGVAVYWKLLRHHGDDGSRPIRAKAFLAGSCGLMLLLAGLAALRVNQYRDPVVLWGHDVAVAPMNALSHEWLGLSLEDAGRIDAAVASYEQAIALDDTGAADTARINLSQILGERGEPERSLMLAQQAAATTPPSSKAFNAVGLAFIRLGQPNHAVDPLRRAVELDADSYSAWTHLGMAQLMRGQLPAAIEALQQAQRIKPDDPRARVVLAKALTQIGRTDEAIGLYQQILATDPGNADVQNSLGVVYARLGRFAEAHHHFAHALKANPRHADAMQNMRRLEQRDE